MGMLRWVHIRSRLFNINILLTCPPSTQVLSHFCRNFYTFNTQSEIMNTSAHQTDYERSRNYRLSVWNEGNLGCLTEAIFRKPTLAAIETCVRRLWGETCENDGTEGDRNYVPVSLDIAWRWNKCYDSWSALKILSLHNYLYSTDMK